MANSIKPVLRGHLWDKEKDRWPLKRGSIDMTWQKKWPFNTGDLIKKFDCMSKLFLPNGEKYVYM